jgi:hypothetical protein
MPTLRPHVSIRSLMLVTGVVAVVLALPGELATMATALAVPGIAATVACWTVLKGRREIAGLIFWFFAAATNVVYTGACLTPAFVGSTRIFLFGLWMLMLGPMSLGSGAVWAKVAAPATERFARMNKRLVIMLGILPLFTLTTLWPFRLAFVIARPKLQMVADRVSANEPMAFPWHAGLFQIVTADLDPESGDVTLLLQNDASNAAGFVRDGQTQTGQHSHRLIVGSYLRIDLGAGWSYLEDD